MQSQEIGIEALEQKIRKKNRSIKFNISSRVFLNLEKNFIIRITEENIDSVRRLGKLK